MKPRPDDYELALRARSGDREALEELIDRARPALLSLAWSELRNYEDAQDATEAALVRIVLHIREVREPERIRAWMKRIVRNEASRMLRDRLDAPIVPDDLEGPSALPSILRLDIDRALLRLPSNHAEAIRLFYLSDLSIRDVARLLGHPEGTVKGWLHRGRRQLALEMKGYGLMNEEKEGTEPEPQGASDTVVLVQTDLTPEEFRLFMEAAAKQNLDVEVIEAANFSLADLLSAVRERGERWTGAKAIFMQERVAGRSSALDAIQYLKENEMIRIQGARMVVLMQELYEPMMAVLRQEGVVNFLKRDDLAAVEDLTRYYRRPYAMWQWFTERTRRSIYFGQVESTRLGYSRLGTEFLLMGMTTDDDSIACQILKRLDVNLQALRENVEGRILPGDAKENEEKQLTDEGKLTLDLTWNLSRSMGDNYIGTEHLLLGLIEKGIASQALADFGVTSERVKAALREMEEERERSQSAPAEETPPEDSLERRFTPRARAIVDLAWGEAKASGNREIGTDHLLLALLWEKGSIAARILAEYGVELKAVRRKVLAYSGEAQEEDSA